MRRTDWRLKFVLCRVSRVNPHNIRQSSLFFTTDKCDTHWSNLSVCGRRFYGNGCGWFMERVRLKNTFHTYMCVWERDREWAWWCFNVFECFNMLECYECVSVCMSRGQSWHCTKYSLNALHIYQLQIIIVSIHKTATLQIAIVYK